MSTLVVGLTGRIMICSSKKSAQKWAAMERSVIGKVVEVRSLGAEKKEPKKSDHFVAKEPVEVIPQAQIRPEEAECLGAEAVVAVEAASTPSLEERKAAIAATVAKRKAAKN